MTRPWPEVAAFYEGLGLPGRPVGALAALARKISESPLAPGLFAWTSMHDLCIAQAEVTYPYDGPYLRLSPSADQIELRYVDSSYRAKQWHRTIEADQAFGRLVKFLNELRWFPPEVLDPLRENPRSGDA